MSELDLKLEWREDQSEATERNDRFEGEVTSEEEGELTVVEETSVPEPPRPEEFEYSVDRARALDAALGRLQAVTRPPFVSYLRRLVDLPVKERTAALDGAEAWLTSQLAYWQVGQVEGHGSEQFSQGVSAGADALGLGLEIVQLLRGGEVSLVEPLLEQVESYLTQAREALSEPPPPEEALPGAEPDSKPEAVENSQGL